MVHHEHRAAEVGDKLIDLGVELRHVALLVLVAAEVRAMLETYGKQVSFVDFDTLDPIVTILQDAAS